MAQGHVLGNGRSGSDVSPGSLAPGCVLPAPPPNCSSQDVSERSVHFSRGEPQHSPRVPQVSSEACRSLLAQPSLTLLGAPGSRGEEPSSTTTLPWQMRKRRWTGLSPQGHCQSGHQNHRVLAELSILAATLGLPGKDLRVKNCFVSLTGASSNLGPFIARERTRDDREGWASSELPHKAALGGTHSRWCRWGGPHQASQPGALRSELEFQWRPRNLSHWTEDEEGARAGRQIFLPSSRKVETPSLSPRNTGAWDIPAGGHRNPERLLPELTPKSEETADGRESTAPRGGSETGIRGSGAAPAWGGGGAHSRIHWTVPEGDVQIRSQDAHTVAQNAFAQMASLEK